MRGQSINKRTLENRLTEARNPKRNWLAKLFLEGDAEHRAHMMARLIETYGPKSSLNSRETFFGMVLASQNFTKLDSVNRTIDSSAQAHTGAEKNADEHRNSEDSRRT